MKKLYLFFVIATLCCGLQAQEVIWIADFEDGTNQGINPWEGHEIEIIENFDPDEVNDSDWILHFIAGNTWGAVNKWDANGNIFNPEYTKFVVDVYIPEGEIAAYGGGGEIAFQLLGLGSISGAPNYSGNVRAANVEQEWVTLYYDITGMQHFDYRQLALQYAGMNCYIDNLRFWIEDPDVNPIWADFEDGTLQGFDPKGWGTDCDTEVVDNPDPDEVNPSNKVLRWHDVNNWGGVWRWQPNVFQPEYYGMRVDIYVGEAPEGEYPARFWLQGFNSESGAENWQSDYVEVTEYGQWVNIYFDLEPLELYDYRILYLMCDTDEFFSDNYQWITEMEMPYFNLTLEAQPPEGGELTGGGEHQQNSVVTVSATPNDGYLFQNWRKDGSVISIEPEFEYVMPDHDVTLTAHFIEEEIDLFTLTLVPSPPNGGTVSGGGEFPEGDEVTIIATANDGFHFIDWMGSAGVVSTEATYVFTMPAENVTLMANFGEGDDETSVPESGSEPNVYATAGAIIAENAENSFVEIYTLSGVKVVSQSLRTTFETIYLQPGFYIVVLDGLKTTKAIVR